MMLALFFSKKSRHVFKYSSVWNKVSVAISLLDHLTFVVPVPFLWFCVQWSNSDESACEKLQTPFRVIYVSWSVLICSVWHCEQAADPSLEPDIASQGYSSLPVPLSLPLWEIAPSPLPMGEHWERECFVTLSRQLRRHYINSLDIARPPLRWRFACPLLRLYGADRWFPIVCLEISVRNVWNMMAAKNAIITAHTCTYFWANCSKPEPHEEGPGMGVGSWWDGRGM